MNERSFWLSLKEKKNEKLTVSGTRKNHSLETVVEGLCVGTVLVDNGVSIENNNLIILCTEKIVVIALHRTE